MSGLEIDFETKSDVDIKKHGVYRQVKVYQRGGALFAAYGAGFIRLYKDGTSLPGVRCEDVETPGWHQSYDAFGKISVHQ